MASAAIDVLKIPSATGGGEHTLLSFSEPPDERWIGRIAAGLKRPRTIYTWLSAGTVVVRCLDKDKNDLGPTDDERSVAERVCRFERPDGTETIDQAYSRESLRAELAKTNKGTVEAIVNSLLSPTGIIPFIGAGMSKPYGVPMWGAFLNEAAASDPRRTEEGKKDIAKLVEDGNFEVAAEKLDSESREHFRDVIGKKLDVEVDPDRTGSGPLSILPLLTAGPVITTNFDRVLEAFFRDSEKPFAPGECIEGAKADPIVNAIQQNRRTLIKLHGDVKSPDTFTFTALQYNKNYGDVLKGIRGDLTKLGNVVYTNRPLLFLGCSLEKDRTLTVLQEVATQNPFLKHYAILAASELKSVLDERQNALKSCAVTPLWFPDEDFGQIEALLKRVLEESATQTIVPDGQPAAVIGRAAAPPPVTTENHAPAVGPAPRLTTRHYHDVAEKIAAGQIVFFLGARAHRTTLLGTPFYVRIAERLGVPFDNRNRADVAEHFIDTVGRESLSRAIEEMISRDFTTPSSVHTLITKLAQRREQPGVDRPVVVFTTNYDDVMEKTLREGKVPHHLFIYQPEGTHAGRFIQRTAGGQLRAIRNPDGVFELEPAAAVVVKMNGGLDPLRELPARFAVAPGDFVLLANRLPGVLPSAVRKYLSRPLLFLGHGMAEPDVRAFGKVARAKRGQGPAWALQKPSRDRLLWRDSYGVEIHSGDLDMYLERLTQTLRQKFQLDV